METLTEEVWGAQEVHLNNISCLTPEIPSCPILVKLFLQDNRTLTRIPPSFFENMPLLRALNLSSTSIQSLPPSISKLTFLQEFLLRDCSLLMELPPEIGALRSLKLLDTEGTEIMYLPKEIANLKAMECLKVSLSAYADDYRERKGITTIIPTMTISKLTRLKELSISVNSEAEWWEIVVLEAILEELRVLPDLETLKLYLPSAEVLQRFLQLQSYRVPIYASLLNFRLIIGHCEKLPCSLPPQFEESFEKLEKCLKYVNGDGITSNIIKLVRNARALFLCRHWTIENLSIFDLDKLEYCLLSECNEMKHLVNSEELSSETVVLGSLQYLCIHYMKKLQSIWRGPIGRGSLSCLRILSLHTCPELTTIFSPYVIDNLETLTELVVEDCPKVTSLVTIEPDVCARGPFLPSLKKMFLLELPELVSISSGVSIAPGLDTLLIFNCVNLKSLSSCELPLGSMKEIKGEIEWWDALNWEKSNCGSIFVQLGRDGALMDQLAEDTNSLQHFLELQTTSPNPGSFLQQDQNSPGKEHGERKLSNHLHTELGREHGRQLQFDLNESASSVKTEELLTDKVLNSNNDAQIIFTGQSKAARGCYKRRSNASVRNVRTSSLQDDGHSWRKYGQKEILNAKYPRSYYRCIHRFAYNCLATKQVQKVDDPPIYEISYRGYHTCIGSASSVTESLFEPHAVSGWRTATESASTVTENSFELPEKLDAVSRNSDSGTGTDSASTITENSFEFPECSAGFLCTDSMFGPELLPDPFEF